MLGQEVINNTDALVQAEAGSDIKSPEHTSVKLQMLLAHRDQCLQQIELAFQKETESIKKRKLSLIRELAEAKQAGNQEVLERLEEEFTAIKGTEERLRDKEQARKKVIDQAAERLSDLE